MSCERQQVEIQWRNLELKYNVQRLLIAASFQIPSEFGLNNLTGIYYSISEMTDPEKFRFKVDDQHTEKDTETTFHVPEFAAVVESVQPSHDTFYEQT